MSIDEKIKQAIGSAAFNEFARFAAAAKVDPAALQAMRTAAASGDAAQLEKLLNDETETMVELALELLSQQSQLIFCLMVCAKTSVALQALDTP